MSRTRRGEPTRQRRVLATVTRLLRRDDRILAVAVVGSLAGGLADSLSDVDLLIMVRAGSFSSLWRSRQRYLRTVLPVVYASEETRARKDIGIYRVLTEDGVKMELAFFAKGAPFHLQGRHRVLFDRGGHVEGMPRGSAARAGPKYALPGGPGDLPFALQDSLKFSVRGRRKEAIEILTAALRAARPESRVGSRPERRRVRALPLARNLRRR